MTGLLYDSSVFIDSFRRDDFSLLLSRRASVDGKVLTVYLSAVALSELYAGAIHARPRKLLKKVESQFTTLNRLIVPTKSDWSISGQILMKIGQKHGFEQIKRSRMTNDCLIAMSARRLGLTVATTNIHDFQMIAEFGSFTLLQA